jgi:hypothetical protein
MAAILANIVEICFGFFTAISLAPATTISSVAGGQIATAPATATVSDLATETHPPRPYDIVEGMERVISMM